MQSSFVVLLCLVACISLTNAFTIYTFGDRVQIQKKDTVDTIADSLKQELQIMNGEKYGKKKWDPRIYRTSRQNTNVIWMKIKVDHKKFLGVVIEDAYSGSPNIIECEVGYDRNMGMKTGALIL
uniref:uncharacterized protein LOC120337352 n=1 Tax=Styela clava TaxID=7725 RepID=UPI001939EC6E|nr:uncharacterized protein LOC120337352 [Styela clava]